jgi:hypothetical protein
MRRCYLAVLCLLCLCNSARAAERAGNTVLLSIGYFMSVNERTEFAVQYIEPTWPSDDVTLGLTTEGPAFWKALYPLVDLKWRLSDRYDVESYSRSIDAHGVIVAGGIGYSFPVWQATLRLKGAAGYSWETVDVHYGGSRLEPLAIDNDQMKWILGAALACPFADRVEALPVTTSCSAPRPRSMVLSGTAGPITSKPPIYTAPCSSGSRRNSGRNSEMAPAAGPLRS